MCMSIDNAPFGRMPLANVIASCEEVVGHLHAALATFHFGLVPRNHTLKLLDDVLNIDVEVFDTMMG